MTRCPSASSRPPQVGPSAAPRHNFPRIAVDAKRVKVDGAGDVLGQCFASKEGQALGLSAASVPAARLTQIVRKSNGFQHDI